MKVNVLTQICALAALIFAFSCSKDAAPATATVGALNCAAVTFSVPAATNIAYTATATVPYTGGNAAAYSAGVGIVSTGATGLTATLQAGTLTSGSGNLTYTITGTPASNGVASFPITFGGQNCVITLPVNLSGPTVAGLSCSAATFSSAATANAAYSGTATIPYTGGNGVAFVSNTSIVSTGVTGLSATLQSVNVATGPGNLIYAISGTPSGSGTATFPIVFGGQSCSLALTVGAAASACASLTGAAKIVCLSNEFKAALSASQLATAQLSYTLSNAETWSNLPAQLAPRLGIKMGDLSAAQLTAAKALVKEMSGTTVNEGWDEIQQLWLADDNLAANGGGSSYGAGNYYVAFFGTPALTGTFEVMMTGHHKTVANTYKDGVLIGATPHFEGVEPTSFTVGTATYTPINQERDALSAMLNGLTAAQLASAKLSGTFTDLILGPGKDWQFPTAHSGLQASALSAAQKQLILTAIKTYTNDIDDADAATILAKYTSELDNTFISYSGTTALQTQTDYVRIDGPSVWIEFTVQGGIIYRNMVHYHSVWRDRISDYGGTH